MKLKLLWLTVLAAFVAPAPLFAQAENQWEQSVVLIEVTRKQYDYMQPWSKRMRNAQKNGIVIGPGEILTTAEELADRTLIRIQKGGRGRWANGDVAWIDYHANLAIVTSKDEQLWKDLRPAELSGAAPGKSDFQIVRWRNGNLEQRKAEFNQYIVDDARLSFISCLQMELSTEMPGVGTGEAVIKAGKVAGLATAQSGNGYRVLPSPFIKSILEARKNGSYRGLGFFPWVWQPSENPEVHQYLKWKGEPRGVLVIDVPGGSSTNGVLKPKDIVLKIDNFDIDIQGYYLDPDYGQLSLENLATRRKFAGDTVRIKIWRDGAETEVNYTLPKADYSVKLLADNLFDQEPEYMVVGGLVFVPLSIPYLRSFGMDWKRSAPFRLSYYNNDSPTKERPSLVLLSTVLPDSYNLGYQDSRYLVLEKVNGQKIGQLKDISAALQKPVDGFHVIEFVKSDSMRRMVLDAAETDTATARVLERYGIQKDRRINTAEGNSADKQ
jgi:hypothetical protein